MFPVWLENLDDEDFVFIKNFIMASGSLKTIAKQYEVSYPTVRIRLDKLIQKIEISEDLEQDSFITLIKNLAINDRLDYSTAKIITKEYEKRSK
jgi:hypothetical protein